MSSLSKKIGILFSLLNCLLHAQNAEWIGATSSDLNTASNWAGDALPTGVAIFDSDYPNINLAPTAVAEFAIDTIYFPNSASGFQFALTAPGSLLFGGAGIIGANTNAQFTMTNATTLSFAQLSFNVPSVSSSSIGSSSFSFVNTSDGSIDFTNAAQLLFADSDSYTPVVPITAGDNVTLSLTNNGVIIGDNEAGQAFLKGGSFTAGDNLIVNVANSGSGSSLEGYSDTGQFTFDASDSIANFTAGDNAQLTFSNGSSGSSGMISSENNNVGQLVLDGKRGTAAFLLGDFANVSFTSQNSSVISNTMYGDDAGQIVMDGNHGVASFTVGDSATLVLSQETGSSTTGLGYDAGQIVIDGDSGTAYFEAGDNLSLTVANQDLCTLISGSDGNDAAQITVDGDGGTAQFTVGNNGVVILTNGGTISSFYNAGQIVLDADGGAVSLTLGDNSSLSVTNSGTIENVLAGSSLAAQIAINGSTNPSGSTMTFGNNVAITATNTSTGVISNAGTDPAAIMYFSSVSLVGAPLLSAIDQSMGSIEGIVFDGTSTADDVNISLSGTSLVINTVADLFTIASLAGDSASIVNLSDNLQIATASGATTSFAGNIANVMGSNELLIAGNGAQVFTGDITFTGDTVVNGGTLVVNGTMASSPITINAGGVLKGTGTVSTVAIEYGGILSPGNSPGTMYSGPATFSSGSIFQVEIDPSQASRLDVTDEAILAGHVQIVQDSGNYPKRGSYEILSASSLSGEFDAYVRGGLPGYDFNLVQILDSIWLNYYYATTLPTSNLSGNALHIADYFNEYAGGAIISLFDGASAKALQSGLNSISPSRNAYGTYIAQQTAFSLSDLVTVHLDGLRFSRGKSFEENLTASLEICPPVERNKFSGWISGFGEFARQAAQNQAYPFHFNTGGVLAGFDYQDPNRTVVGGTLGYAHTHYYEKQNAGDGNINYYFASLYGNRFIGDFYLSPAIWGLFDQIDNTRRVVVPGYFETPRADIFAWQLVPHLELGYDIDRSWGQAIPFTSLDWAISWQRGYTEHGGTLFNAKQRGSGSSLARSETGLKVSQRWDRGWGAFSLREKLSYIFEKPFGTSAVPLTFVGTPGSFTVASFTKTLNLGAFGLDFLFSIRKENPYLLILSYEGEFGSNYWSNQVMLNLKRSF